MGVESITAMGALVLLGGGVISYLVAKVNRLERANRELWALLMRTATEHNDTISHLHRYLGRGVDDPDRNLPGGPQL